jgi:aspartate/methionine/tyrosine aminotransferase
MRLASRVGAIEPFWVMECAKTADEIARGPLCDPARGGRPMVYLNIGEPDQTAAPAVTTAAKALLDSGRTQYTAATGLPALREAIAGWYRQREGLEIDPARIVVTAGASGALQLLTMALVEPGDQWLMADPAYPCNRHFILAAGGDARLLPTGPAERFQLDPAMVQAAWTPRTRGVLLASPSNPTGTSVPFETLQALAHTVSQRDGVLVVDEIYQALSYGGPDGDSRSALHLGDDVIVVNSFSKYFGMTGWRLGWLVLPPALVAPVERLAQNFTICPSVIAQHAALASFTPETLALCESRRRAFQARRDFIVPALNDLGLTVPVMPDGAFFAWLDVRRYASDSWDFCHDLMRRAQIALTPGRDFGQADAATYARLSYASSLDHLHEAVRRLQAVLPEWPERTDR